MKIYLAGPLFTEAERAFNLELAHLLEKEGHEVYLPQRDTPAASGPGRTATLFRANLTGLNHADCGVTICDGPQVDDGPAWEIGYAWGRKIRVLWFRTYSRDAQQQDAAVNLTVRRSLATLSSS